LRRSPDLRCNRARALAGVNGLAPIEGGASGVVLLQKPKGFADHLTRRVVAARSDFGADEFFESPSHRERADPPRANSPVTRFDTPSESANQSLPLTDDTDRSRRRDILVRSANACGMRRQANA
jgi:hypothetical protein